ncbi:uncharacterized protein EDB93DRAFT_1245631 [Suillus bovinus]|uniref:uncharacterized protein n=1 Tax=Suillus bovinus TaxID=48563 RepID=UPI001B87089E|nr:uncharacterized protein EDB93DRAFT_1245631 [Suillus bovinus]KAG2159076.1 hypothetical protein EDB93DRAFT_1245631 [Suillus bovinus]
MSSSTQALIPHLHLGSTFGALFIGVTFAAILFGLSNVQAFVYFQTHKGTGISFYKLAVAWLWIIDALHLFLIVHCIYYYLVTHYADIDALIGIVWSFKLQIVTNVLIVYGVQLLYFHRICIVAKGRSKVPPIVVGVVVISAGGWFVIWYPSSLDLDFFSPSGVAIVIIWAIYQCHVFSDLIKMEWATFMACGTITLVDFVIASSLCYLLAISRTGFSSTDSMLTKLMVYVINTGCLTSICSLSVIITCATMPQNFIFLGIEFLVAKLYVNSFIALLNAPHYLQSAAETNTSTEVHMRHGIYRPELNVMVSQDEGLQGSHENMSKHPGDDVVHLLDLPRQAAA